MREEFKHICVPDRTGTNSRKWDNLQAMYGRTDLLPLWVADMDFRAPDSVVEALNEYVAKGIFGYYMPNEEYYTNFIKWEKERHSYEVKKEWIRFSAGVATCLHSIVHIFSKENDGVMLLTPVYYPFMDCANDTNRKLVCCPLVDNNGYYTVDYKLFEEKIIENNVKVFLMSSPHNPVGRVWKSEELIAMLDICKKHNVFVVSDELHQDLIFADNKHIPAATLGEYDEMMVTMTAGSKTFNLGGFQNSYIIIPSEKVRAKFDKYMDYLRVKSGNNLGYIAVEAAYKGGHSWLEAVKEEIYKNYNYMKDELTKSYEKVIVSPLEGTYLMWFDLGAYIKHDEFENFIVNDCKLAVDFGDWFFPVEDKNSTYLRLNLATPFENIKKATNQIIKALDEKIKN